MNFEKYQGTGNDFIIISGISTISQANIVSLCDRKFGIGADGLILMNKDSALDFDMMYYNADGSESFCGNGSRCSIQYAKDQGWIKDRCTFNSNDGIHEGIIDGDIIKLKMHDVSSVLNNQDHFVLNTGSPHYIAYTDNLNDLPLVDFAQKIRYSDRYKQDGINVNYIHEGQDHLQIRTYERGVEDETLSCGTGVTAAALAHYVNTGNTSDSIIQKVKTQGGELEVHFNHNTQGFTEIYLCGPAVYVFSGVIELD